MVEILILDHNKPVETFQCLQSVKVFCKFPHRVILYSNGGFQKHISDFYEKGFIDLAILNNQNQGLGIGTRDLFKIASSRKCLYLQNDQVISREITDKEINFIFSFIDKETSDGKRIKSVSISGSPCGEHVYSERAHFIELPFYEIMERSIPLSIGGAGPFHHLTWREEQIQKFYQENNYTHLTNYSPAVTDRGFYAVRDMGMGGLWVHRTDTKRLYLVRKPIELNKQYPKLSERERGIVMRGEWVNGTIPEAEAGHSFRCWGNDDMDNNYVQQLRRFCEKR